MNREREPQRSKGAAKKAVTKAKNRAYEDFYRKLDIKKGGEAYF